MKINLFYILIIILILTSRSYILMIMDKRRAVKNQWRISERRLFIAAWLFGSLGIWLGMLPPVNHKKSKSSFIWKMIGISAVQLFLIYTIYNGIGEYFYWKW